jgi:hypothetical protein
VSLTHVLLALSMVGLHLFLVPLIFVVLGLIWTLGNEVIGATTIVACPLLLIWKLSLYYLVALLL